MIRKQASSEAGESGSNQDYYLVGTHPADSDLVISIIADGQGGRAGGVEAAKLACELMLLRASVQPTEQLQNPLVWSGMVQRTDKDIKTIAEAGLTTIVAIGLRRNQVTGASQGDSAAFLQQGDSITELTRNQHKNPPVGSGEVLPRSFEMELASPWVLLLVTDGVWKYAGIERITRLMKEQRADDTLINEIQEAARLSKSGRFPDDFTILAFSERGN